MNRLLVRAAVLALTVPLATVPLAAGGSPAFAEDPTCVGSTSVGFVCDPYVDPDVPVGVETYTHTEEVCVVVMCDDVDLTLVRTTSGEPLDLCVGWTTRNGDPGGYCWSDLIRGGNVGCNLLKLLAPGTSPVEISPEGDVYINDEWFFDCPPYGA